MAILQLALDFTELERALAIAKKAEKYADWLEAGTPLIKSEGLDAVRKLKVAFPRKKIVADMKIMDTGALEAEIAAKAGADYVTVMAAADLGTIREAIEAAKRYGAEVIVDVLGVSPSRIKEIEKLSPAYFCFHAGIDQQMAGASILETLKALKISVPLSAAGGLDKSSVGAVVKGGAQVIVVGGAITKAKDPEKAAAEIRAAIDRPRAIARKQESIFDMLSKVSTCNISDAMQRKGELLPFPVKLNYKGEKISGRALTVQTFDGDWAKPVEAIDNAGEGDILVISGGGSPKALFGGLAAESCRQRKLKAVIIDGACRDADEIAKLPLKVFANMLSPTAGEPKGFGEIGVEVACNGAKVKQGDLIVIDSSGIVAIPREREFEIVKRALDIAEKEQRIRQEIKEGSTLSKVLKLNKWELRYK